METFFFLWLNSVGDLSGKERAGYSASELYVSCNDLPELLVDLYGCSNKMLDYMSAMTWLRNLD